MVTDLINKDNGQKIDVGKKYLQQIIKVLINLQKSLTNRQDE